MSVSRLPTASAGRGGLPSSVLTSVYSLSAPEWVSTASLSDLGILASGRMLPEPRGPRALTLPSPKYCPSSALGLSVTIQYTPLPPLANCWTRLFSHVPESIGPCAVPEPVEVCVWALWSAMSWAMENPPVAWFSLASSRPFLTCPITTKPSSSTTPTDISSVTATTRNCRFRRHSRVAGCSGRRAQRTHERITGSSPRKGSASRLSSRSRSYDAHISAGSRLVPDSPDRHHDLRTLGVLLDLRAQPLHMDVDQPGVGGVPITPDLLQQHLAGEHLPRLAGKRHQQVELQRRQSDR